MIRTRFWTVGTIGSLLLPILLGCTPQTDPDPTSVPTLDTSKLDSVVVRLPQSSGLYWPTFLSLSDEGYFWGEGNLVYRIDVAAAQVLPKPTNWPFVEGHDRLIAMASSSAGRLVLLDSSGDVTVHDPMTGRTWKFSSDLQERAADLAISDMTVYILQEADREAEVSAVVAFDLEGHRVGEWGEMTADALIQATLEGGGITSCPDGTVFYSYINSPRLLRLSTQGAKKVDSLGHPDASFQELRSQDVRKAYRASDEQRSVGPLVKLGLSASRVMSLFCSSSGLVFRQVAHPQGAGSIIEVWDPGAGALLGKVDTETGILLSVEEETLILGTRIEDEGVLLERLQCNLAHRTGEPS